MLELSALAVDTVYDGLLYNRAEVFNPMAFACGFAMTGKDESTGALFLSMDIERAEYISRKFESIVQASGTKECNYDYTSAESFIEGHAIATIDQIFWDIII